MHISPYEFRGAYERFQSIEEAESGNRLQSFADPNSAASKGEGYKRAIHENARRALTLEDWSERSIGSGEILEKVVAAIALEGNNLVQWQPRQGPKSRAHHRMLEARQDDQKRAHIETLLFGLYRNRRTDEATFEGLVGLCGKRYELLAYLYFLADSHRFLPIRTSTFDRVLRDLGANLTTRGRCEWGNYQAFLDIMREIQEELRHAGIRDATLLDAHSFCWILGTTDTSEAASRSPLIHPFDGHFCTEGPSNRFERRDDAPVVDQSRLDSLKRDAGRRAELIAFEAESAKLRTSGRPDLADAVELVSDRPGLGFDLRSFETDGTEKQIEVKNISGSPRFFLTHSEWLNSRARPNYWFYLVKEDTPPSVMALPAGDVRPEHLQPSEYMVSFNQLGSTSIAFSNRGDQSTIP
ncbi:MAG: DUF3883 domain-containing protein [Planctomycetota bacterium]